MTRLIDADALVNNINERIENMTGVGVAVDAAYLWALIYEEIKDAPTIEPSKSADQNVADVPSGDLISRAEATSIPFLPKEHRRYQTMNIDDAYEQGWCDLEECIQSLPSADRPQVNSAEWVAEKEREFEELNRPKGEWVRYKRCDSVGDEIYAVMEAPDGKFFCNQCGKSAIRSDFCPNCGADMKGVKY